MTDLSEADRLLEKINFAVAAANEAEKTSEAAKAEHVSRSKAVGLLLLEAKRLHPKVADFEAFLKRVNGLKLSRAYDYLRIAGGRATDEQLREEARERQKKSREKKKRLSPPEKPTKTEPEPISVTVTETDRITRSPEISAEERRAQNAALDTEPERLPEPEVSARSEAVALHAAIETLIDAAKRAVDFANVLPRGVVYGKADLDTVISRLQSLNKSMAKLRKAARAEAA